MDKLFEGYYLVDVCDDLYAVKGVVHPPDRLYAIPRVVGGVKIKDLQAAAGYVNTKRPEYVFDDPYTGRAVAAIPTEYVKHPIYPSRRATGPRRVVDAAEELAGYLEGVVEDFGFTGSLLTGFFSDKPDIDIVIYGDRRDYEALKRMRAEEVTHPVNTENLQLLLDSRADTARAVEMLPLEGRKVLTGVFKGFLYTFKIVPKAFWEGWEDTRCKPLGYVEAVLRVTDCSEGFYTPGRLKVEGRAHGVECREVVFFRSRFAETAEEGEVVKVRGLLERVVRRGELLYRINVGLDREDYILVDRVWGE